MVTFSAPSNGVVVVVQRATAAAAASGRSDIRVRVCVGVFVDVCVWQSTEAARGSLMNAMRERERERERERAM